MLRNVRPSIFHINFETVYTVEYTKGRKKEVEILGTRYFESIGKELAILHFAKYPNTHLVKGIIYINDKDPR
jgi:hypothetical protein